MVAAEAGLRRPFSMDGSSNGVPHLVETSPSEQQAFVKCAKPKPCRSTSDNGELLGEARKVRQGRDCSRSSALGMQRDTLIDLPR